MKPREAKSAPGWRWQVEVETNTGWTKTSVWASSSGEALDAAITALHVRPEVHHIIDSRKPVRG